MQLRVDEEDGSGSEKKRGGPEKLRRMTMMDGDLAFTGILQ